MLPKSNVLPPGAIKRYPQDFVVREVHEDHATGNSIVLGPVTENNVRPRKSPSQRFTLFKLTKEGVSAQAAYNILASSFEIDRWRVTDCGQKDAQAVTTQYVVIEGSYVPRCHDERLRLEYMGPASGPLARGGHQANFFSILVRSNEATPPPTNGWFANYFGPQRFGGEGNALIGRSLLEGDVDRVIDLILGTRNAVFLKRVAARHRSSLEAALWSPAFAHERNFMVSQWRSFLWNLLVSQRLHLDELPKDTVVPLWTSEVAGEYGHLWECDHNHIAPLLQEALFASNRPVWAHAYKHEVKRCADGWRHEFILKPGCYATVFLATMYDITDASTQQLLLQAAE